jgi:hypothetical protein
MRAAREWPTQRSGTRTRTRRLGSDMTCAFECVRSIATRRVLALLSVVCFLASPKHAGFHTRYSPEWRRALDCPSPPAPLPKQVWGEGCQAFKKNVNDEGGKAIALRACVARMSTFCAHFPTHCRFLELQILRELRLDRLYALARGDCPMVDYICSTQTLCNLFRCVFLPVYRASNFTA